MRDLVAVLVVLFLVGFALSMATSLHWYRRGHARLRRAIAESGQSIVAEIPGDDTLGFFTEDGKAFHWQDRTIPKDRIRGALVLISGAPISFCLARRFSEAAPPNGYSPQEGFALDKPSGIERDRWDVAIDVDGGTVLVECGSIRECVSQELARMVFEAVKTDIEIRDQVDA